MESYTLAEQEAAVCTLHLLCRMFPYLPNGDHEIGTVSGADYAHGLTVRIHDDPPAFEAWREALDLDPEQLKSHTVGTDFLAISGVALNFGAPVELVGYLPLPAEVPDAAA